MIRANNPAYAATIEAVDQNVGRIVDALSRLRLTDNTVVIFTSDNGGTPQFTPPLHGSKGELYEGGIRVPLAISWSGLKKPGSTCDAPVTSVDWYPTLLELAGLKPQSRPDSRRHQPTSPRCSKCTDAFPKAHVLALPLLHRPGDAVECTFGKAISS